VLKVSYVEIGDMDVLQSASAFLNSKHIKNGTTDGGHFRVRDLCFMTTGACVAADVESPINFETLASTQAS
jgi:hypothetical protein